MDISFSAGELPSGRRQSRAVVTLVPMQVMPHGSVDEHSAELGDDGGAASLNKNERPAVVASLFAFARPTAGSRSRPDALEDRRGGPAR